MANCEKIGLTIWGNKITLESETKLKKTLDFATLQFSAIDRILCKTSCKFDLDIYQQKLQTKHIFENIEGEVKVRNNVNENVKSPPQKRNT